MASQGDPVEHIITIPAKNFKRKYACSVDFGGSLLKSVYCIPDGDNLRIHCATFSCKDIKEGLLYLKSKAHEALSHGGQFDMCGVGTFQQEQLIKEILDVELITVHSELTAFVLGFQSLAESTPLEELVFPESEVVNQYVKKYMDDMTKTLSADRGRNITLWKAPESGADGNANVKETATAADPQENATNSQLMPISLDYPVLLIMTGSGGCPILIQEQNGQYKYMDGHTLGGRFFLGFGSLLTGAKSFEELVSLAENGNHEKLNVLLKDLKHQGKNAGIYSALPDEPVFNNFGHAVWKDRSDFKREDLAAAALTATAMYLAQTYQLWCAILDVKKVFFCGSFTSSNQHLRDELSKHFTIRNLLNKLGKKTQHYFLRSGAYLGCIGCMLMTLQRDPSL